MNQAPICKVHGVPMREWKPGNWSCSVRGTGDGFNQNGFCVERVSPDRKPGGGGRSFGKSPEEQRSIAAQSAFKSACDFYSQRGDATPDLIMALALRGFKFIAAMMGQTPSGPVTPQRPTQSSTTIPAHYEDEVPFPDDDDRSPF